MTVADEAAENGTVGITDPAVADSRLLLGLLSDHMDEAVCLYDAEDRVVGWNENYPKFFPEVRALLRPGVPFTETVRPLLEQQFPEARDPDKLPRFLAAATARHRSIAGPMTYQRVFDGRWVEMRMFLLPGGGRFKIWRDVTRERLEAVDLAQLNDAMSTLQVGILVFDRERRLALMNAQFFGDMTGGFSIEPPQIGQPGGRPACIERIRPVLVDDENTRRLAALGVDEVLAQPLDIDTVTGRSYRVQETISGKGMAATWIDITERRRLERSLSAALEAEKQVRAEQRQLTAMLAHEVRSPLGVISATAQILQLTTGADDRAAQERVAKIFRASRRLSELVDGCLAEERLDSPDMVLNPSTFDLTALVADVCDEARTVRGRDIGLDAEPDLILVADIALIRIAISNLVENAAKYTGADTMIEVAAQRDGREYAVTVTDHGTGIADDDLPRIFDKYFRAEATGASPGAGLGLHIVKRIVERHDGRIAAASGPDGSRFTIRLPYGRR